MKRPIDGKNECNPQVMLGKPTCNNKEEDTLFNK